MTVLAVADGSHQPQGTVLERLQDKVSGLGIVRFDKPKRKITIECWPFLADVTQPGTQFRGWPVSVEMTDNYGRKEAARLPKLEIRGIKEPLLEVVDERNGELVYCLRLAMASWQPHVFMAGKYTVRISEPESGKVKELKGLEAKAGNEAKLEVVV